MQAKDNIIEAFWLLHREKSIEKITIKELMDKAGYHRSLFYVYFKDIYDLAAQEQAQFFAELNKFLPYIIEVFMSGRKDILAENISHNFFQKYADKVTILLGQYGDIAFQFKLKELIRTNLYKMLNLPKDDYKTKLAMEFFVNGHINAIIYFYHNQHNLKVTDYWQMIRTILSSVFKSDKI